MSTNAGRQHLTPKSVLEAALLLLLLISFRRDLKCEEACVTHADLLNDAILRQALTPTAARVAYHTATASTVVPRAELMRGGCERRLPGEGSSAACTAGWRDVEGDPRRRRARRLPRRLDTLKRRDVAEAEVVVDHVRCQLDVSQR
eukprot:291373-Pleurochrysis_carterae.AAC.5